MTLYDTIRLIKSLTTAEKRNFTMTSRRQAGAKDYLALYDIINKSASDEKTIRTLFRQQYPATSLINTTQYLGKLLIACLFSSKTEKDIFFQAMQNILESRILSERSIHEEARNKISQVRKMAVTSQQHWLEYFTYRHELDYYADQDFHGISDIKLISLQLKSKEILRNLNHIQDHHALFELLKYRLVHSGKISSDDERKKMNDLMLSEMTLVAGKNKNSFLSNKLHLLFQAFFFINSGDYQTALKTFHSLDALFEKHLNLLDHPPMDYLSTLNGIADSLYTLGKTNEINYYLDKARNLDQPAYPEYFRLQVRKMITVYKLAVMISQQQFDEAVKFIAKIDQNLLSMYNMLSDEKQWELFFYCSLAHFKTKNWKKAHDYVLKIMQQERPQSRLVICQAVRLLNILIYYEKRESSYVMYEIRSYKRFFAKEGTGFRSEQLVLRLITHWPDKKLIRPSVTERKKILNDVVSNMADKYERQLLKYFDFSEWVRTKISR